MLDAARFFHRLDSARRALPSFRRIFIVCYSPGKSYTVIRKLASILFSRVRRRSGLVMLLPKSDKPRLIVLEGPAGAGKTTVQRFLWQSLVADGIKANLLSEFSSSPLGEALRNDTRYGQQKPPWVLGVGGVLALLGDKIFSLATAAEDAGAIWIADRLIISQLILGLRSIETGWERTLMEEVITSLFFWVGDFFSDESFLVLLEAPLDVLAQRLQGRTGHSLTQAQRFLLQDEISRYAHLSFPLPGWNQVRISSHTSLESLGGQLIHTISSRWMK
jgi:thymidylate kinase